MSKQIVETKPPEETQQKQNLIEQIRKFFSIFSMMIQAFEGKDLNPDNDVITRLINVKNILERSNFPSMSIINFQVYCRLVAHYHPELDAFKKWADFQAESLKSLEGLSSEQYVEMMKAQNGYAPQPSTNFGINLNGQQAQAQQAQQKRGGWFRRGKSEPVKELKD
jgi:hypothetical protein